MIYLKVRGGLCNRIRALDSLLTLCEKHEKDLLILWPEDIALNASFNDLFHKPRVKGFQLEVISCPPAYPERYLPNFNNKIKNFIRGRSLEGNLTSLVKKINKISDENKLSESFLDNHYNKIISETQGEVEDMDNIFCERLRDFTNKIMTTKNDSYINSCYRLVEIEDSYRKFIPNEDISIRIERTLLKFNYTFGLHIRRSDHEASKKISTLDKFIEVIEVELKHDSDANFFLSTDDALTKTRLIERYGKKIIYNDISSFDRASTLAVKEAVLDLYCLSKTKKIYGSHHSSFSQVASAIGEIKGITVK